MPERQFLTETFAKVLVVFVVRQAHHERKELNDFKTTTVRPEPFDKLRRALSKGVFRVLQEAQLTEIIDPR